MKTNRIFLWVLISFSFSCISEKGKLKHNLAKSYFNNIKKENYEAIFQNSLLDSTIKEPFYSFLKLEKSIYGELKNFEVIEDDSAKIRDIEEQILTYRGNENIHISHACGIFPYIKNHPIMILCKVQYEKSEHFTSLLFIQDVTEINKYKLVCTEGFSSKHKISNAVFTQGASFIEKVKEKKYQDLYQIFSPNLKKKYAINDSIFHSKNDSIFKYFPTNNLGKIEPYLHRTYLQTRIIQNSVIVIPILSLYYKIPNKNMNDYIKIDFIYENKQLFLLDTNLFCKSCK